MFTKPTALYRVFLREAFALTWQRKNLWVFGIFAALISTGGVADIVAASLKKIETTGSFLEGLTHSSFIWYELVGTYIHKMAILGSGRVTLSVTVATLVCVLLVVAATIAQGGLILGLKSSKPQKLYSLKLEAAKHFFQLLLIATLNKLTSALVVFLLALPLFSFYVVTSSNSALLFFLLALVLIPTLVVIQIVYQFTLLGIVDRGLCVHDAFTRGTRLFARHWIATLEYGLILFALVICALFACLLILTLMSVPYAIIFTTTLLTGIPSLFFAANLLFGLFLIALMLAFIGATTTFQYSAWYEFYKHGTHRIHGKKVFSKLFRLVHK
jgi:hypothetical protein